MKKKYLCMLLALVMVLSALTGCCGQGVSVVLNGDGTCTYTVKYLYEKEMFADILKESSSSDVFLLNGDFTQGEETVNGIAYLTYTRSLSFANVEILKSTLTDVNAYIAKLKEGSAKPDSYTLEEVTAAPFSEVTLDAHTFIAKITSTTDVDSTNALMSSDVADLSKSSLGTDIGGIDKKSLNGYDNIMEYLKAAGIVMEYSITFPANVTESNGTISGATASWSVDSIPADSRLVAVTDGNLISSDTEAPVISGVKEGSLYRKGVQVQISDNVSLKKVSVNGITIANTTFRLATSKKYTVTATDSNGNTSSVQFQVDTKAPVIRGIRNGKKVKKAVTLRFRDNDKIARVTVNGKKVGTKKLTVKKPGRYVVKVTDKAGNTAKRVFRIVK